MKNKIDILSPISVIQNPLRTVASDSLELVGNNVQPDLLYMKSVLVSTGQNKNDDVFLPDEMWKARLSPILKPVDWEHNTGKELLDSPLQQLENPKEIVRGNQIIGAMYNSYVADKNGAIISEDKAQADDFEVPSEFDIINEAVIYKYLFPKAAERIVSQANSNGLFVSMEAWFNKFDYRVGNKIVARNEDTAFLDRHLRSNGGDGFFSGEKIGRVLRNIVFGGIGIVANPANVDSVIQSFTNADYENTEIANSTVASNIIGVLNSDSQETQEVYEVMSTPNDNSPATTPVAAVDNEDYKNVVQQLVKAEHTIETRDKELEAAKAKIDELENSSENLKSAFAKGVEAIANVLGPNCGLDKATAENFFDILANALTDKLSHSDELKAKLDKVQAELQKLEDDRVLAERKAKIRDALGLTVSADDSDELKASKAAKVDRLVESTQSFDADAFEQFVNETAELLALSAKKPPFGKKDEDEEDMKKKKGEATEDDGVTNTEILDNVQPVTASVDAGSEDVDGNVSLQESMKSLAADLMKANKRVQED